jgi:hypothetical protein
MQTIELIQPAEVKRDDFGFWYHPGIPDDVEDGAAFRKWLEAQGLITFRRDLEDESDEHPTYVKYFEDEDPDVREWNPEPPVGEGWFTLAIFDTEDGPTWMWAMRREKP